MTVKTPPQPIKLIAIDLDGTLLNTQHEMSAHTEKTLKAAIAKGVSVVIATGKTFRAAQHLVKRLGTSAPGIFAQGTITYNQDGSIHSQYTIPAGIARQVITFAEDRGHQVAFYSGNRILVRAMKRRIEELTTHYHEPMPEAVGPLQNMLDNTPVNKIIAIYPGGERETQALRWQLNMQLNGSARLLSVGIGDEIEILPAGASKGAALKGLLKEMKLNPSDVMAIGDGENDIEMLEFAGVGVAMGNAPAHVKKVANFTVGTNDEDGVAQAVERFVLDASSNPAEPVTEAKTAVASVEAN